MGGMIIKVLLCLAIPLLMLTGVLEKRSRSIISALVLGSFMCIAAYWVNTYFYGVFDFDKFYLTTTFAPMCEEVLKFVPVLCFGLFFSKDKNNILPVAFAIGLGFAVTENGYMLMQNTSDATVAWLIIRGIGTGLMHGMTTSIMGYGISLASSDRRLTVLGTMSALFLAVMYHGAYNCLVQTDIAKYFGILLPGFTYGGILFIYHKDKFKKFLTEK